MNNPGIVQVLLSLVLVGVAIAIARWWKIPVEKEMAFGSVRSFIQLIAVGYALKYIFELDSAILIILAIFIMITVGAYTIKGRAKKIEGAFAIAFIAITAATIATLGLMLLLRIIDWQARYVIPLAGMIISNSMNAAVLTMNRIASDVRTNRLAIETSLALGKSWKVASRPYQQEAVIAGMTSMLNFMKTVGIVALPGAMTGMILAGADPLSAVLLQIIVAYMLLSAATISSIIGLYMTVKKFFTSCDQLVLKVNPEAKKG
jgi:putative ABC transport system permease protein